MQPLSLNVIRKKYLDFFVSKGHLCLDSFPLVPQDDNSLLLINAGMAPLKKYFTGEKTPPRKRVTTCQKCVRTLDIDNVGKTARHGTFFEMLGNFSFGDYFKSEAIPWAWEFLTTVMEIPEDKLYPSVYTDDDEAFAIWQKVGVPAERITRMGKEDNFWEIGAGPCGPCSEIYFDRGEKYGCGKPDCAPGCDCDRFIEIWNIVFTQFEGDGNGNYERLAHPNIDTGMGLERLACVMQDVNNLFEVDTIRNIMNHVCRIANVNYTASSHENDVSLRVITDHIRTAVFLISDGVIPSNEGRGYILRRVLRRAARHGKLLGIEKSFLSELAETVIHENITAYPELTERKDYIKLTISREEERFRQTIDAGLGMLEKLIDSALANGDTMLSGQELFKLYDTFGFPLDLTKEISLEKGLNIDEKAFYALMNEQKRRAREARAALGDVSWADESLAALEKGEKTEFCGYTQTKCDCNIKAIIASGEQQSVLYGGKALLVLDTTPFYAESGGQVGDTGVITTSDGTFTVTDTKKSPDGQFLHIGTLSSGEIKLGKAVAEIDEERRLSIARNHSSVHLLQAALRQVLGVHVHQAGSYVDEFRARFDFTHSGAMTTDEILETEDIVNNAILGAYDVCVETKSLEEAKNDGAMALFGEKYGDTVREVKMGEFSSELCGGTHIQNTSRIGLFRILTETSVAAGVRRIEAVTGFNTLALFRTRDRMLNNIQTVLKANNPEDIVKRAEDIQTEIKQVKKSLESAELTAIYLKVAEKFESAVKIGGVRLVRADFEDTAVESLRSAADSLVAKNPDSVCLFSTHAGGKLMLVASCGKDALSFKAHAGNLLKTIAPIIGGGGGGRPDSAVSGGKDVSKLHEAFEHAAEVIKNQLGLDK